MSNESVSTLRRKSSSYSGSCIDPFDQAEKGLDLDTDKLSNAIHPHPLEARKHLSYRYSLRSTDSTLVGIPGESPELGLHDEAIKPLPHQGKL
jgi:hypothetical protein